MGSPGNLGLEGAEKLSQEGILGGERQHPLLHHGALHIIVHQNHVLLEDLDSKELPFALQLREHDLVVGRDTG